MLLNRRINTIQLFIKMDHFSFQLKVAFSNIKLTLNVTCLHFWGMGVVLAGCYDIARLFSVVARTFVVVAEIFWLS